MCPDAEESGDGGTPTASTAGVTSHADKLRSHVAHPFTGRAMPLRSCLKRGRVRGFAPHMLFCPPRSGGQKRGVWRAQPSKHPLFRQALNTSHQTSGIMKTTTPTRLYPGGDAGACGPRVCSHSGVARRSRATPERWFRRDEAAPSLPPQGMSRWSTTNCVLRSTYA